MIEFLPSALRHRLVLERLERMPDMGGGFAESWVSEATVWADLRPIAGSERFESDRLAGALTHAINLRYRPGVLPEMRFREDTRIFHILAVIDMGERRRWLQCACEERDL